MNEWNDKVYWISRGQSMAKRFPPSSLLHTCLQFEAPFQPGDSRTFWMSPKSNIISSMRQQIKRKDHGEESHGTCKRSIRHCLKQLHRNICTSLKWVGHHTTKEVTMAVWKSRDSYIFLLWIHNLLLLTNGTFVGDTEKIEWGRWGSKNVSLMKTIAIAAIETTRRPHFTK